MAKKERLKIDNPLRYTFKLIKGGKIKQTEKDKEKNRQRYKPKTIYIVDTVLKKRVAYAKFQKTFDLTKSELMHLKSKESLAGFSLQRDRQNYFKRFSEVRNFKFLLDVNNLTDLEKYRIKYNEKIISYAQLEDKIYDFLEKIDREYYKFYINVNIVNGIAYTILSYKIILHQWDEAKSLVDQYGNFIIWSS